MFTSNQETVLSPKRVSPPLTEIKKKSGGIIVRENRSLLYSETKTFYGMNFVGRKESDRNLSERIETFKLDEPGIRNNHSLRTSPSPRLPHRTNTITESNMDVNSSKTKSETVNPVRMKTFYKGSDDKKNIFRPAETKTAFSNNLNTDFNPTISYYSNSIERLLALKTKYIKVRNSPDLKYRRVIQEIREPLNYSFAVGPGNNAEVIKRVMKKRYWWKEMNENSNTNSVHFAWHQSSKKHNYEVLVRSGRKSTKIVNHFEFHQEITTKSGLLRNLSEYCEQLSLNVFDYTPVTFMIDIDDKNLEFDLQEFIKYYQRFASSSEDASFLVSKFSSLFRETFSYRTIMKAVFYKPQINPKNLKVHSTYFRGTNLWLLKPIDFNRGRGIELFNSLDGLKELLVNASKLSGNGPKIKRFVLQKYIESPLLITNRKFDIRVWALLDQDLNLYFFKEGYLRLSSEEYSINDKQKDNLYVHLTNNAIQKYSTKYGQFESGNQLSFTDFEKHLPSDNPKADLRKVIIPKIKELMKLSMSSARYKINANDRKYCFEIFGYDFMIDSEFNVWLIEINTNPCLEESSTLLKALMPRMIDDAFKLTIDNIFPKTARMFKPEEFLQKNEDYPVPGYGDKQNMWYNSLLPSSENA